MSLKLGAEATPELADKTKPDVVILAVGGRPIIPEIPGVEKRNVLAAQDVLEDKTKIRNQNVVVAGGGMVGAETAEVLREKVPQLYAVGDCQQPRAIMAAVYEGAFTALQR